jgi:glycosyltransferase involved in cell wall biosynthesis
MVADRRAGPRRALVVTAAPVTTEAHDQAGIFSRLRIFLDAVADVADEIEIAYFMPPGFHDAWPEREALDAAISAYWRHPMRATVIPWRTRAETFANHYLHGLVAAAEQPVVAPYAGPDQAEAVGRLLDRGHDLVFVHRLPAMCAVLRSGRRPRNLFFDIDDVEHRVRLRYATRPPVWPGKLAYAAHAPALLAAECRGAWRSRRSFVCSEKDRAYLARFGIGSRLAVVPNAKPVPADPPGVVAAPTLMFIGTCDYPPNVEAAERLVTRILPLVRREVPGARAIIAGKSSDRLPSRSGAPEGVEYLGFVEDLDALYARTRVVCCPIGIGGGTRIKLIEAAAHARPMVSTAIGAEGLDFIPGAEILIEDTDEGFARACIGLLRDDAACGRLGEAARARMRGLYDEATIRHRVAGMMWASVAHASGAA